MLYFLTQLSFSPFYIFHASSPSFITIYIIEGASGIEGSGRKRHLQMEIRRLKISNSNFKRLYIIIGLTLFLLVTVFNFPALAAKSALDIGVVGVGARNLGMGKSGVAIADDANAVFVNPAGLAAQKNWTATCMSTKLMDRVDYKLVGGSYRTQYGTLGIGYITLSTPAGYLTTNKASLTGAAPISYGSQQLVLSYGRSLNEIISGTSILGGLDFGINFKLLANNFGGYDGSASGTSVDIGFIAKPRDNLSLGVAFQNMFGSVNWNNGSSEDLESKTKLGVAGKFWDNKLTVSLDTDIVIGRSSPMLIHTGAEWTPLSVIVLRAGLDQDPLASSAITNLTAGLGIKLAGFSFDYAYHQDSKLSGNSSHYISISFVPTINQDVFANKQSDNISVTQTITTEPLRTNVKDQDFGILSYYK